MYPVYTTTTKSGIITGNGMAIPWDNEAHDLTIERIIKGLFYNHYNKIIGIDAVIKTYWFKEPFYGWEDNLC